MARTINQHRRKRKRRQQAADQSRRGTSAARGSPDAVSFFAIPPVPAARRKSGTHIFRIGGYPDNHGNTASLQSDSRVLRPGERL